MNRRRELDSEESPQEMLMGNGPLPLQEEEGDDLILNNGEVEEEGEASQTVTSEQNPDE